MQVTCPNCDTKYEIENDNLGDEGRNVQCSHCKHIWFAKMEDDVPTPPFFEDSQEHQEQDLAQENMRLEELLTTDPEFSADTEMKDEIELSKMEVEKLERIPEKVVHETVVKNLPVVVKEDMSEEIKNILIRSQKMSGRLSVMLFLTFFMNMLVFVLLALLAVAIFVL